jgi:hypothetical protein
MATDGCHRARLIGLTTKAAVDATEWLIVIGDAISKKRR